MTIYDFMGEHPWLTIMLALIADSAFVGMLNFGLRTLNRGWRHRNILKHGYPPPHCDADGDFKPEKKAEG